ncbi:MAG TPA: amino acid ABC transporter permease [Lachnospiraceae bacterium]|nr:amino acid ABC transporter permease [Lachnospiraceae bacterium]
MHLNVKFMIEDIPTVLTGLKVTLELTLLSYVGAIILALIAGVILIAKVPVLQRIVVVLNTIIKGLPLIVQLLFCYYALPYLFRFLSDVLPFYTFDPKHPNYFFFASVALSVNFGAYMTDLVVSSYKAVDPGQSEAYKAVGMTPLQGIVHIVGPQALIISLPGLSNYFMWLLKATSLASVVNVFEILAVSRASTAVNYAILEGYIIAAAMYWIVCVIGETALNGLNKKLGNMKGGQRSYGRA